MAVYKTSWFARWARKQGMQSSSLCRAVEEMAHGLVDADLGAGLFKKRIARSSAGKSSGFRTLIATNRLNRWIFVFGFAKNARGNIEPGEQEALQKLSRHLLTMDAESVALAMRAGELIEVNCHEKDTIADS